MTYLHVSKSMSYHNSSVFKLVLQFTGGQDAIFYEITLKLKCDQPSTYAHPICHLQRYVRNFNFQ